MKKILKYFCIILVAFSILTSCGNSDDNSSTALNEKLVVEEIAEQSTEESIEDTKQENTEEITDNTKQEDAEKTIENIKQEEVVENEDIIEEITEDSKEEIVAETSEKIVEEVSFTYLDLNKTMYSTTNLNVRNMPNADGEKLGSFQKGTAVEVTGSCRETGWLRVKYGSQTGYVSADYMSDEKPVVEAMVSAQKTSTEKASADSQQKSSGNTVWVSATGSKYHSKNNCGRMNPSKATQMTESQAISIGLGKCSKCW